MFCVPLSPSQTPGTVLFQLDVDCCFFCVSPDTKMVFVKAGCAVEHGLIFRASAYVVGINVAFSFADVCL